MKQSIVLRRMFITFAACLSILSSFAQVFAANENVLWNFTYAGNDGLNPYAGVTKDASGNLYGTTFYGGANNEGAVFKLSPQRNESVLWSFGNTNDGANPKARLILDALGDLYGTTAYGGIHGGGTVFKVTPKGNETILWNLGNGNDGQIPFAGVTMDQSGNLYGTTYSGGLYGSGTLFEVTPLGHESVLWNFGNGSDGSSPLASPILDAKGNLYGTTQYGGAYGLGTVFKVTPQGSESVLWSFGNGSDGANPFAELIMDAVGNFYGTTTQGGRYGGVNPGGTVFELTAEGNESVLWSFGKNNDGESPAGCLVRDDAGNLYGETSGGAAYAGTIFELAADGNESTLWTFGKGSDGNGPSGGLIRDLSGNLFGTTALGGGPYNSGTVFEIFTAPSAQIYLKPRSVIFPNTTIGSMSIFKLGIRNTGNAQLTGTVNAPVAPFGLSGSGNFDLAPNQETTIALTFTPSSGTPVRGSSTVASNSVNNALIKFAMQGSGVP